MTRDDALELGSVVTEVLDVRQRQAEAKQAREDADAYQARKAKRNRRIVWSLVVGIFTGIGSIAGWIGWYGDSRADAATAKQVEIERREDGVERFERNETAISDNTATIGAVDRALADHVDEARKASTVEARRDARNEVMLEQLLQQAGRGQPSDKRLRKAEAKAVNELGLPPPPSSGT